MYKRTGKDPFSVGKLEDKIDFLKEAVSMTPKGIFAHLMLSKLYADIGDVKSSDREHEIAMQLIDGFLAQRLYYRVAPYVYAVKGIIYESKGMRRQYRNLRCR